MIAVHAVIRYYCKPKLWSRASSLLQTKSKIMQRFFHDLIINILYGGNMRTCLHALAAVITSYEPTASCTGTQ